MAGALNKACEEGYQWYCLPYPVYRGLGIDEKNFVAIHKLLGKKDPVAEHFAKLRRQDAEWEDMQDFAPKDRTIMLVFVHEEADKGLQFYETSYHSFGKQLQEEVDDNGEEFATNFDDIEGGATVQVRFKAENIGMGNPWIKAGKINLIEREDGFTADDDDELMELILDKAAEITLDDCLKIPTYEELRAALDGEPAPGDEDDDGEADPEDDEPEEKPARKARKGKAAKKDPPPSDDEDDDDEEEPAFAKGDTVEHDEHGTSTITRVLKGGKCHLKDEDGELQKNVPMAELTAAEEAEDEEPEPEPKPKKSKGKGKGKKADPEPEPEPDEDEGEGDDDWDDDWDD